MRRRIGTVAAAFVIFIGSSIVSLAAETGLRRQRHYAGADKITKATATVPILRHIKRSFIVRRTLEC